MKIKKINLLVALCFILAASLCGCGKDKDKKDKESSSKASSGAYVTYNGTDVVIGSSFDSIKDKLGTEASPSQTIEPCDGGDYVTTIYFYDGLEITKLERDGSIVNIALNMGSNDDALICGKVKKGDSVDSVKEALGTPDSEDEFSINYTIETSPVCIYLDNGVVTGATIFSAQ